VKNVGEREEILPLIYYKPFKASALFLKHHYPEMDLQDYSDKFWHAEKYFQVIKQEESFELN